MFANGKDSERSDGHLFHDEYQPGSRDRRTKLYVVPGTGRILSLDSSFNITELYCNLFTQ